MTSKQEQIDYIIQQQYPHQYPHIDNDSKRRDFVDYFNSYSDTEIHTMYEDERKRSKIRNFWYHEAKILWEQSEIEITFWSKLSSWRMEEAAALAVKKDPRDLVQPDINVPIAHILYDYPEVEQYRNIQKITEQAVRDGALTDPISPARYIAWARQQGIDFPEELAAEVPKSDLELVSAPQIQENSPKTAKKPVDKNHAALMRERNTLLKLFFGVVVDFYGYDTKAERSPIPKEIESSLERLGVRISDDTIRKYLNEAKEHLPAGFQGD